MEKSAVIYAELVQYACHYAKKSSIKRCALGENCLAVESDLGCGLAFLERSFWGVMPSRNELNALEQEISSMRLETLIPKYLDDDALTVALAFAAINSVCVASSGYAPGEFALRNILDTHKRLGMVGFFCPLLPEVRASGIDLEIFELRDIAGTHRPQAAAEIMPHCDLVVFTGSTFVNKTFHFYQPYLASGADVYILGPSTPLASVLCKNFSLGGSLVRAESEDDVFNAIRQGYNYRRLQPWLTKVVAYRV
ncbi:MAG: hypothetical protein GX055_08180 [Desulfovibrionales bacterium]|nr:hypothetical protein [Desulfovibrionales bacterium]